MIDFLASVDPMTLPLWAVVLFAASMYPMGLMLGSSCSPCCAQPCRNDTCDGFDLEEAMSKCRWGGTTACFRSGDLLSLRFLPQCYGVGSGAAGTVSGVGGRPDNPQSRGPLTGVTLTSGGSGYAVLGRRAPSITLANIATVPAATTVNLVNQKESCDFDSWRIDSVTVTNGGRGYANGSYAVFSIEDGCTTQREALGRLISQRERPAVTASASPGTGAIFSVELEQAGTTMFPYWRVASISVSGNSSGYVEGTPLVFSSDASDFYHAIAVVHATESGQISSVEITHQGVYYIDGVLVGVEVEPGGAYYVSDPSLPAYVRPPIVEILQGAYPLNTGVGAVVTPTVDSNPESASFGTVTALTLTNAGNHYIAWYADNIERIADDRFAFQGVFAQVGCRVRGDGFDGVVTEAKWEFPYEYTWAPKKGCCRHVYTIQRCRYYTYNQQGAFGTVGMICDGDIEEFTRVGGFSSAPITEEECDSLAPPSPTSQVYFDYPNDSMYVVRSVSPSAWSECRTCDDRDAGRGLASISRPPGRWTVTVATVSGDLDSASAGCLTFCGRSGLCQAPRSPYPSEPGEAFGGPYGSDPAISQYDGDIRRMCMRWICRCYEGTGQRGVSGGPDDWYTVKSTSEDIGGPLVFGGGLAEKLDSATTRLNAEFEKLEHEYIFETLGWSAEQGDVLCAVYGFGFYGYSTGMGIQCENPVFNPPRTTTPLDMYVIVPCQRCGCE